MNWKSVTDTPPPVDTWVLVCWPGDEYPCAALYCTTRKAVSKCSQWRGTEGWFGKPPPLWTEFPAIPKEEHGL